MGFGKTADRRRQAARKHAKRLHKCAVCGREIKGNAFYRHKETHKKVKTERGGDT